MASHEQGKPYVGVFLRRGEAAEGRSEQAAPNQHVEDLGDASPMEALYRTGTFARIVQMAPFVHESPGPEKSRQGMQILLHGQRCIRLDGVADTEGPPPSGLVTHLTKKPEETSAPDPDEVKATVNAIMQTVRDIMKVNPQFREHMAMIYSDLERIDTKDLVAISYFAASLTTAT